MDEDEIDLSQVPQEESRLVLRLSEFLQKYPNSPLNIEMKGSFKRKITDSNRKGLKDNIKAFIDLLIKGQNNRTIVLVSASDSVIDTFREIAGDRFPTGLSALEQLALLTIGLDMHNRALETSYSKLLSDESLVRRVAENHGSTFVFLTEFSFLLPAIDDEIPKDKEIFEILDRGIDGIMTDRPAAVREIIDRWIQRASM